MRLPSCGEHQGEAKRELLLGKASPFLKSIPKPWLPTEMAIAPELPVGKESTAVEPRYVLLVNPFYKKDAHGSFGKHVLTPSLALTSIAAATPSHWRAAYWDENLLHGCPPCDPVPQVVGITVHLTFARRAFELARWFREQGSRVVLGGLHVQSCPEECAPHADALAIGDGVQLWPRILHDAEHDCLQPSYVAGYDNDYSCDPPPRREILPQRSFLTTTSLIATRGCHNRCGFCYLSTSGLRMPYRTRTPQSVAAEFAASDEPYGVFVDNNLGSQKTYLRELCRALRPVEKIWSAAVSIDVTDDPQLVREMALAGCTGVFIGFESLTDANLESALKKTPKASEYARCVRILHDCGIQVNGSFVFGFDHDRPDVFPRTIDWIEENRLECATFHILTPYPNTPLFGQLEAEERILHHDWSLYDTAHAVFRPRHMTPEELEQGYAWSYQRLFQCASVWKRRPQDWHAVLPYLAMSFLYKRSNRLWHLLIKHDLVHTIWSPLVEVTRRRHLRFRQGLATSEITARTSGQVLPAGV